MRKIHQLPQHVVAKIAAGEVIERPVFAVKELVENAIDAKSDWIRVHIEDSGLKKITVIDNGEGMKPDDLEQSFKPHTTSKLASSEELSHISTLGFRGEALASIAAISTLTINSKVSKATAGSSASIKNGNLEKIAPVGMPSGTSVTVEHLFHSHPVRKKFLKSPRTEFRLIVDLLIGYSLSYHTIHFLLTHNKKIILDLPKTSEIAARIEKLMGRDLFSSLIPVALGDSHISISGFIAKPTFTTRTPTKQLLFINNRLVSDKGISLSIKTAYGSMLASNVYPISILHFTLPYETVDVNVHPRKEFVRFFDNALLLDATKRAVLQALARYDLTPDAGLGGLFLSDAVGSTQSYAGRLLREKKMPWLLATSKLDYLSIVQVDNLYLLVTSKSGLLLIDQHAAHERILYEQLQKEFVTEKRKHVLFHFSKPGVFDLSISESELLSEHLDKFAELGWEIEHFKDNTFIIQSLPVLFQDRDYVKLLAEMLEDLHVDGLQKTVDDISKRMLAYLACRGAVKAGDKLTKKQAKDLVIQLEKTENNATCPHGRPTKIAIPLDHINRLFKR